MTRLVTAVDLVTADLRYARVALGPEDRGAAPGFVAYVSHAGLKNTLGRAWLVALARRAVGHEPSGWSVQASETRGLPLVNVERVVAFDGVAVNIGLQLQNWRMQAFAEPHPYEDVQIASPEQRAAVDACIDGIRRTLSLPAVQQPGSTGGDGDGPLKGRYHRSVGLPAAVEEFDVAGWAEAMARVIPALARVGASDEDATP